MVRYIEFFPTHKVVDVIGHIILMDQVRVLV